MYYYANLVCTILQMSEQSFANAVLVPPSHYILIIPNVSMSRYFFSFLLVASKGCLVCLEVEPLAFFLPVHTFIPVAVLRATLLTFSKS